MSHTPPHLEFVEEEEILEPFVPGQKHSRYGLQWPSKYGAWGRRAYKAKGSKWNRQKTK